MKHPLLIRWIKAGRVVSICPEVIAGLPTPRMPAEITLAPDTVCDINGKDLSAAFQAGAQAALALAQVHGCGAALLTDGSPSCGTGSIYDGTFSGTRIAGQGLTAALLRANGIAVFSGSEIENLAIFIEDL